MKKMILISGPCVIENDETPFVIAEKMSTLCRKLNIEYIFKASYDKANRTKHHTFRGIEFEKAMEILNGIKKQFNVPVLTDVHETIEVKAVADVVDYIQIPAFLCRQTDLLLEAGRSGKKINIKKGQFVAAEAMEHAANKAKSTGAAAVMLTERGTFFGYNDMVVDFRNIAIMKKFGMPVLMDASHTQQKPNQSSGFTGGVSDFTELMCRTGLAAGADGLFIETHPEPAQAMSDGNIMTPLNEMEALLEKCLKVFEVMRKL